MGSNVHHLRSSDGLSVCIGAAFTQEEEEEQEGPISNAAPLRVGRGGGEKSAKLGTSQVIARSIWLQRGIFGKYFMY